MNYAALSAAIQDYTQNYEPEFVANIPVFVRQAEQRIYNSVQFPSLRKNVTGTTSLGNRYLSCPTDFLSVYSMAVIDASGAYEYLLNKDVNFIRQAYPQPTDTATPKYYAIFGPTVTGTTITDELSFILGPTPDAAYSVELHYYYYPESIVQSTISTVSITNSGSGYVNGTYFNVPLTGGSGSLATANFVISGGVVTSVTVVNPGSYYVVSNTLSAASANLGGAGTGLVLTVTQVSNADGQTWLGDNFDTVLLYGSLVEAYTFMKGEADMMALYDNKYKEALMLAKRLGDGLERSDAYRSGQARVAPLPQNNGVQ